MTPLSPHEIAGPAWQKIELYLTERLQKHRSRLESRLIEADTVRLRGQISELKELIALGHPEQATEVIDAE